NEPLPLAIDTILEDNSYDMPPIQFLALSSAKLHDTTLPLANRLTGYIDGKPVTILVDFGSSHNIIQPLQVLLLHLPTDGKPSLLVMIGNGTFLH
ncbi:hypothetical protein Tco_0342111, partial [Tanacetum coccineum]